MKVGNGRFQKSLIRGHRDHYRVIMRLAFILTLITSMMLFSPKAAVRVVRMEGTANVVRGFMSAPKSLRVGDVVAVGDAVSVGTNSFLDLQFEDAHQLLRLLNNTAITFDANRYETGYRPSIDIGFAWGKVCGISSFTNAAYLSIQSEESGCTVEGPGRVDFVFNGHKAASLAGTISMMWATSTDRCRGYYFISPRKPTDKIQELEINEQEVAFLKQQFRSLEGLIDSENKEMKGGRRTTPKGKRITPL
jgi:hypothetical protein